jgi:tricorn protease
MKKLILSALFLLLSQPCQAQGTRLLRNPAVSNDHIAFVYGGDIWLTDLAGNNLKRLTSFPGEEQQPHFSPDGRILAFSGQYDGNIDVFSVSVTGGEPVRLTWHPGPDIVQGFSIDGKSVLFSSGRENAPRGSLDQLWTIPLSGGMPARFVISRAVNGKFSPNGNRFVYEEIAPWESEFRNYRGGQNVPLKVIDLKTLSVEKMPWENSRDISPVWIDKQIFFLSDRDLGMNIWVYNTDSKTVEQLTFFKEFDCKNLEGNQQTLIFENGGYLHKMDISTKKITTLDIIIAADFAWSRPHYEEVKNDLQAVSISPTGRRIAAEARGEILTMPAKDGDIRNLSNSTASADRLPAWSPDGKSISWFSDESGEYQLFIANQFGKIDKKISFEKPTFYYTPLWSADSKYISYADADRTLWIVEVSSGKITKVDNEGFVPPQRLIYPEWSPDSKWLTYTKRLKNEYGAIFIYSLEQKKAFQITDGMSDCNAPAWDASGKYIYFTASTDYGMNVGWLDMSSYQHPVTRSIYMAVLSKETVSPIAPKSDEEIAKKEEEKETSETDKKSKRDDKKPEEKPKVEDVKIDVDGIQDRIINLILPAKNYVELKAGKEGILFIGELPESGDGMSLGRYSLEKRELEELATDVTFFDISADNLKMVYGTTKKEVIITATEGKPKPAEETVAITDVKILVDPIAEGKQMFKEAWRYQRDYFYVKNVHGLDMDWAYKTYSPWVNDVRHRSDLNYVLDIFSGETSIGHSFVRGGDYPDIDYVPTGMLGADIYVENGLFKIKKIYNGESWNPDVAAPLVVLGHPISAGDYILSVNGKELDATINFYSYFERTAGKQTFITVNSKSNLDSAKQITVVPVKNEAALRQYDWVESNRRKVDELSNGQLAYVWIPNTGDGGYTNFNRYYFAQKNKKGAIIDERFNTGGSIADYIVDLLARDLMGYFNNPVADKQPFTAPNAGIFGPKVMLINEMSGSGGDMLPFMFKKRKVGPIIGTKTWGGLVGIWDVPSLIDGGSITAPRGGFYNTEGEWDVENIGVSPDILVEQTPKLVAEGHDPQLEKAVQVAMDLLKTQSVKLLPQPADPVRVLRPKK